MVCVFITGIMVKVCIYHVAMEMEFGGSSLFYLPNWVGQIILPAGFALLLFRFLIQAINQGGRMLRGFLK